MYDSVPRSGCEIKAAAALIASARMWFAALRHDLFYGANGDSDYRIAVVAFRQDATNSKLKQCHMELECGIIVVGEPSDAGVAHDIESNLQGLQTVKYLSDVIPVQEGSGLATVGMTLKMLESLGCPTWREFKTRQQSLAQKLLDEQVEQINAKSVGHVDSGAVEMCALEAKAIQQQLVYSMMVTCSMFACSFHEAHESVSFLA